MVNGEENVYLAQPSTSKKLKGSTKGKRTPQEWMKREKASKDKKNNERAKENCFYCKWLEHWKKKYPYYLVDVKDKKKEKDKCHYEFIKLF